MAAKAKPQVTRFLQSAAQQADKIDWKIVGALDTVIGGIAVVNGMSHRRWRYIHTLGVVRGIAAAIAPRLVRIFGGAGRTPNTG